MDVFNISQEKVSEKHYFGLLNACESNSDRMGSYCNTLAYNNSYKKKFSTPQKSLKFKVHSVEKLIPS